MATGTFKWNSPEVGDRHKFILFLAQESTIPEQGLALDKLAKYGFADVGLGEGGRS